MNENHLRFRNSRKTDLPIILEPWGEETSIPSDSSLDIFLEGTQGPIEVDTAETATIVYLPAGTTYEVFLDGKPILGTPGGAGSISVPSSELMEKINKAGR